MLGQSYVSRKGVVQKVGMEAKQGKNKHKLITVLQVKLLLECNFHVSMIYVWKTTCIICTICIKWNKRMFKTKQKDYPACSKTKLSQKRNCICCPTWIFQPLSLQCYSMMAMYVPGPCVYEQYIKCSPMVCPFSCPEDVFDVVVADHCPCGQCQDGRWPTPPTGQTGYVK